MKLELLAPNRNIADLPILKSSGADSIYFGIEDYSARPNDVAYSNQGIIDIINSAKDISIKAYAALNAEYAQYYGQEKKLIKIFEVLNENKCDAVIISDLNILELYKELGFNIPLHISTLTGIYNHYFGQWIVNRYKPERIILSTNLYLQEISDIIKFLKKKTKFEIIVQNGACYNSANRCRLHDLHEFNNFKPYQNEDCSGYKLKYWCSEKYNAKLYNQNYGSKKWLGEPVINCLSLLPTFIALGINTFKIEGRTLPVSLITKQLKAYRSVLDRLKKNNDPYLLWHYIIHFSELFPEINNKENENKDILKFYFYE